MDVRPGVRGAPTPETMRERRRGFPGQRPPGEPHREFIDPETVGVRPMRGRFLRPRALDINQVPQKMLAANPNRLGAWIFNNGGQLELPIPLPGSTAGPGLALAKVLDSGSVQVPSFFPSTYKSLYLRVTTALAWAGAVQPTIQLLVARSPWPPASGAVSGAGGATENFVKGAVASVGPAAATSLAVGLWAFSAADLTDLQWYHPYIGAEFVLGGALTAGAALLFLQAPGGPALMLGEDDRMNPLVAGDRAGAFPIPAQSSAMWVQTDGELWAASSAGGTLDCRIWEVLIRPPISQGPGYGTT